MKEIRISKLNNNIKKSNQKKGNLKKKIIKTYIKYFSNFYNKCFIIKFF